MLDGEPVRNFGIVASFLGGEQAFHTKDGRFVFTTGNRFSDFEIVGHGFVSHTIPNSVLIDGKRVEVGDIVVTHGATITGHVRDHAGTAIVGARVTLDPGRAHPEPTELRALAVGVITTTTDVDGAFTIAGAAAPFLSPGHARIVAANDFLASWPVEVQYRDQSVDLEVLPAGGVSAAIPEQTVLRIMPVSGGWFADAFASGREPVRVDNLPEGDYRVSVSDLGAGTIADKLVSVAAGVVTQVDFAIASSVATVEIHAAGPPCTTISLRPSAISPPATIMQCVSGTARFEAVSPGIYRACVTFARGEPQCSPVIVRHNAGPLQHVELQQ